MSFPNKSDRQRCWDAKDKYWECLEKNSENKEACTAIRKIYESNCSAQWVSVYQVILHNINESLYLACLNKQKILF